MTRKLQILIVINLVLLVGIGWTLTRSDKREIEQDDTARQFALQDTAGVNYLEIAGHQIRRQPDQTWLIDETYQVQERVIRTAFTILQGIEAKRQASQATAESAEGIMASKGVDVKIFANGAQRLSYRIAPGPDQDALAQLPGGEPFLVYLPGYFFDLYEFFDLKVHEWRENRILLTSPRTLQQLTLDYPAQPANNVAIRWEGDPRSPTAFFVVKGVNTLDTAQLWDYLVRFEQFSVRFLPDRQMLKDSLKAESPICVIRLEDAVADRNNALEVYRYQDALLGISGKTEEVVELDQRFINPRSRFSLLVSPDYFRRKTP